MFGKKIATNTVDFFNELSLLYGLVSDQAQEKYVKIDDASIFPVNESEPFPPNFEQNYVKDMFKRMFRVFAIIYHRHFDKVQELDAAAHLNTCFKHFMFFAFWYAPFSRHLALH
ncbi:hypothetical protein BASA81_012114 [Batrachochytrium salamandrivorans]|nr:hypothetical protein BASA81_012114 [Batrachochytrium salamandrivorans]